MTRRAAIGGLVGTLALFGCVPGARADDAPAGRTLLGGVTSTVDGAVQSVSGATSGAIALPSTSDVVTTVTDVASSTVQVVGGTVAQVTAPVTDAVEGAQAAIALPGLVAVDGGAVLDLVVGNVGTQACTPVADVAISAADGLRVGGGLTRLLAVAPGASRDFALPWPSGLDAGTYDVRATVTGCGAAQGIALSIRVGEPAGRSTSTDGGASAGGSSGPTAPGGTGAPPPTAAAGGSVQGAPAGTGGSRESDAAERPSTSDRAAGGATATPLVADSGERRRPARQRGRASAPRTLSGARPTGATSMRVAGGLTRSLAGDAECLARASGSVTATTAAPRRGGVSRAVSAVARALPSVLERAAPALAALGLIGALFLLQEALAKRDPKLALAPVGPLDGLAFEEPSAVLRRFVAPPPARSDGQPPDDGPPDR